MKVRLTKLFPASPITERHGSPVIEGTIVMGAASEGYSLAIRTNEDTDEGIMTSIIDYTQDIGDSKILVTRNSVYQLEYIQETGTND